MVSIPSCPWWYTAEEIVHATAEGLSESSGEASRWLTEGVKFLHWAYLYDDLDRCLAEPVSSIDMRWDTLIAVTIRYRLRLLGVPAPRWTFKQPLPRIWFPFAVLPWAATTAMNLAPLELRRVGIFIPETAFDFPTRDELATNGVFDAFLATTSTRPDPLDVAGSRDHSA